MAFQTVSITVYAPQGQAGTENVGASRVIDLQQITGKDAYDAFGVDVVSGYQIFDDWADYPALPYENFGRVVVDDGPWKGKTLAIIAEPMLRPDANAARHIHVLLQEVRLSA